MQVLVKDLKQGQTFTDDLGTHFVLMKLSDGVVGFDVSDQTEGYFNDNELVTLVTNPLECYHLVKGSALVTPEG